MLSLGSRGVCHELPEDQFQPEAPLGLGWWESGASQGFCSCPSGRAETWHRDKQAKPIAQPWVQP